MNWLTGKRVLPRWKLIAMILIGVWMGAMISNESYVFPIIWGLLGLWEITKRTSK